MNDSIISFGRKAVQVQCVEEFLDLERLEGHSNRFNTLDSLIGIFLIRSIQGERVVEMLPRKDQELSVTLHGLHPEHRAFVEENYRLDHQQLHGAWFLPSEVSLRTGTINFSANFQQYARFASSITWEEHGKVLLGSSADALLVWALLEPLFDALFEPFTLRGRLTGNKSREDQIKSWDAIDMLFEALAIEVSNELAVIRYGGGWHKLRSQEQTTAKQHLLAALAQQIEPTTATRYRAYCFHSLLKYYYQKANPDGQVKRKHALTKPLEHVIAGYFAGDWLAFLKYIGEAPHPDEQIVTALPKTQLHIGGATRASEVAMQMGIPVAEVERMMSSYWQQSESKSPVEQRVDFLKHYWQIFDEIHARQKVGMRPLWGLVEDNHSFSFFYHDPNQPYVPRLYLQLLPSETLSRIENLWGTMMSSRWPDRILSEPFPHASLAEALGPALKFWHGCSLTAWFLCEGPSSRTNMEGLAEYYRKEIKLLEELGTPIDTSLFRELIKAEQHLGPALPLSQNSTVSRKAGISITVTQNFGTRRDGFESLRDIISSYRCLWTEKYFNQYLSKRWEIEIRQAGHAYNLFVSEMSKAPAPKQFAKEAVVVVNHWFGGNLSGLYGAIREKSLVEPKRISILPVDRVAFAFAVFQALGGNPFFRQEYANAPSQDYQVRRQEWDRNAQLSDLAGLSFWYVQLEEGLGHSPELKDFGLSKFTKHSSLINEDVNEAWRTYQRIIEASKQRSDMLPPMLKVPNDIVIPQHNQAFTNPQQHTNSLVSDSQPPEKKRSWLDRFLRRQ